MATRVRFSIYFFFEISVFEITRVKYSLQTFIYSLILCRVLPTITRVWPKGLQPLVGKSQIFHSLLGQR